MENFVINKYKYLLWTSARWCYSTITSLFIVHWCHFILVC